MRKQKLNFKPKILETKDGKKAFVVLPYEDFEAFMEILQDAQDLMTLRAAKKQEKKSPSFSLDEAKKELGIS